MRRVIFNELIITGTPSVIFDWTIEQFVKSVIRQIIQIFLVPREELIPLFINILSSRSYLAPFWCLRQQLYIQIDWDLVDLNLPLFKFAFAFDWIIAISLFAGSLESDLQIFSRVLESRVAAPFFDSGKLRANHVLRSLIELFGQIYFLRHRSIVFKLDSTDRLERVCMPRYWVTMLPNNWHGRRVLMHGMSVWKVILVQSLLRNGFLNRIFLLFPQQLSYLFDFIFNRPGLFLDFLRNLKDIKSLMRGVYDSYLSRIVQRWSIDCRSIWGCALMLDFRCHFLIHFRRKSPFVLFCFEIIEESKQCDCFNYNFNYYK